jgi:nitrate reductase gamma subunit
MLAKIILACITVPVAIFYFTIWFQYIRRRTRRLRRLSRICDALAMAVLVTWDIVGFWPTIVENWQDGIFFMGLTFFLIALGITIWNAFHEWGTTKN